MELLVILALILLNGLFAMSELAVVAARKARLSQLAGEGSGAARTALKLKNNPDTFLSTIQVGITLVGVLAGAFGGRTLAEPLADVLAGTPALEPYSLQLALVVVVGGITYLTLVLGGGPHSAVRGLVSRL